MLAIAEIIPSGASAFVITKENITRHKIVAAAPQSTGAATKKSFEFLKFPDVLYKRHPS
jgi:hypothetical protein